MMQFEIPDLAALVETVSMALWLLVIAAMIGGFMRACSAVFVVTPDGQIRRKPNPDWDALKAIGVGMLGVVGLVSIMFFFSQDLLTGAVDLKALKSDAGQALCRVERLCTLDGLLAVVGMKP